MRRFWRWTLNVAAAASLLLFIGTAALWARSYWAEHKLVRFGRGYVCGGWSERGKVWLQAYQDRRNRVPWWMYNNDNAVSAELDAMGFKTHLGFALVPTRGLVAVPHWFLCMLFLILPTVWYRRRRLPRSGHCESCGYNLTGNISGICPECGRAIVAKA
jgi:hypothetical protein